MGNNKQVKLKKGLFGYDEDMIFTMDESGDFYKYNVERIVTGKQIGRAHV